MQNLSLYLTCHNFHSHLVLNPAVDLLNFELDVFVIRDHQYTYFKSVVKHFFLTISFNWFLTCDWIDFLDQALW